MRAFVVSVIVASVLAACGSPEFIPPQPTSGKAPNSAVTSVTMKYPTWTMTVGETMQLQATPVNINGGATAAVSQMTWSSSDRAVATVTENGLVTALASGNASIIANADGHTAATFLTVTAASP